jgi:hypothetical protein
MGHDWIIDVLSDVRRFARLNDMPQLSAQLDDAMLVATTEVANIRARPANWQPDDQTPQEHEHPK